MFSDRARGSMSKEAGLWDRIKDTTYLGRVPSKFIDYAIISLGLLAGSALILHLINKHPAYNVPDPGAATINGMASLALLAVTWAILQSDREEGLARFQIEDHEFSHKAGRPNVLYFFITNKGLHDSVVKDARIVVMDEEKSVIEIPNLKKSVLGTGEKTVDLMVRSGDRAKFFEGLFQEFEPHMGEQARLEVTPVVGEGDTYKFKIPEKKTH